MTFQGKILFIVALAFFIQKIRCEVETTQKGHMFLARGINNNEEAADQVDDDDDDDTTTPLPSTSASPSSHYPIQGTVYEDLHSPEAMKLLTEEYVGLVETEIAAQTFDSIVTRLKALLTDRKAVKSFRDLRTEIYKFMTNPKTPGMVEKHLKNRYDYYVNENTPALLEQHFKNVEWTIQNRDISKHIAFFRRMAIDFLTQPEDVRKRIAEGFTLLFAVLRLPPIPFILS